MDYNTEPPSEDNVNTGDNIFINIVWMFFELITIFKDFYDISVKPTFHTLTNGYFSSRVTAIYKGIWDVHTYSSLIEFEHDQYFHEPYKFMIYTDVPENGGQNKKYIIRNDGEEITHSLIHEEHKLSKASILVLRAYIPNSNEKYDINLKLPENYMIVGNVFNHYFIAWYILKHYSLPYDDSELLHTELEYMNSSYKVETVSAPYEIRINEKDVEIYEVDTESEVSTDVYSDSYEDSENGNVTSDHESDESDDKEEVVTTKESSSPTFTFEKKIETNEELDKLDSKEESSTKDYRNRTRKEDNGEKEMEKPEGKVSFEVSVDKIDKKPKRGRKKNPIGQESCTCGICGEEYHITELNEYLLCGHCT